MASNYDDKFLYNLANNLQDELSEERVQKENAQNFASENQAGYANGTIEEGVQENDIETLDLSTKEKNYLNELKESMKNIGIISDSEIKKIYNELKTKFYADSNTKKQFKQSQKIVKAMIKSDKKRTNLRFIKNAGKLTSILTVIAGVYYGVVKGYTPVEAYREPTMTTIDYFQSLVNLNWNYYAIKVPEAEIIAGAFALGVAGYVAGKGLVKLDDMKTLRRLMVQVCAEEMTISELQSLKNAIKVEGNSVKEAMITYPLRDYGKSSETLAKEKWMEIQHRFEEESKAREESNIEKPKKARKIKIEVSDLNK